MSRSIEYSQACTLHFNELPVELIHHTFLALPGPQSLFPLSRVCRKWKWVIESEHLWRRAFEKFIGSSTLFSMSWKQRCAWVASKHKRLFFSRDYSQLLWAVHNGFTSYFKELVLPPSEACEMHEIMCIAAGLGHIDIVDTLLRKRVDVNAKNSKQETAMLVAAQCGEPDIVRFLANRRGRCTINAACGLRGDTPLCAATRNKDAATLVALLSCGADPTSNGVERGMTEEDEEEEQEATPAIQIAIESNWRQGIEILARSMLANNTLDSQCIEGETPLIFATGMGQASIVELLLAQGADPNVRNDQSETALMTAVRFGYDDIAAALIRAGADCRPCVVNRCGESVYDIARAEENDTILRLLDFACNNTNKTLTHGASATLNHNNSHNNNTTYNTHHSRTQPCRQHQHHTYPTQHAQHHISSQEESEEDEEREQQQRQQHQLEEGEDTHSRSMLLT